MVFRDLVSIFLVGPESSTTRTLDRGALDGVVALSARSISFPSSEIDNSESLEGLTWTGGSLDIWMRLTTGSSTVIV
jgi:hypothetical protein